MEPHTTAASSTKYLLPQGDRRRTEEQSVGTMLDLTDAFARIERARKQSEELNQGFMEWQKSGGLQCIGERDPQFARYGWFIVMNAEPSDNLALVAGEIFNNLRSALDYIAYQIYLKGGGDPEAKQAKSVGFPIVTEEERWDNVVAANVPFAWDEATEKLKWCQPFVQLGQEITALPALRGVGATDKHRSLVMYAMGVFSISGTHPGASPGQSFVLLMAQPGPVVRLGQPALLGSVFLTNDLKSGDEALVPWSEGVKLEPPSPPGVNFGFRASDNSEITIDAIPPLISYVEQILRRFEKLEDPGI